MSKRKKILAAKAQKPVLNRMRMMVYSIAAVIAAVGIAETTYLTASHLAGANVICVASAGCSQVLRSVYASVGGFPLAALGALGYFAAFSAATLSAFGYRRAPDALAAIVGLMFLSTLWLLYVQAYVLHTFCDYCLLSAALVFLLAGLVIAIPRRPPASA
ncbi:MAG: vitamin K epoxide reductase family protein [Verrucomicrobiota bacterium]|nr:vitamin K epoxide reductase family protein [Verrucomicrobiota bacterium]